jgi:hypothetical protein
MSKILEILNDRITVNDINGKTEAVSALRELREAIMGPLLKQDSEFAGIVGDLQANHSAQLYLNQRSLEMVLKLCEKFRS